MGVEELYNKFIQGGNSSKIMKMYYKNIKNLSNPQNGYQMDKDIYYFIFKNNPLMIVQCSKSSDNYYYYKDSYYKLDTSEINTFDNKKNLIPNYCLLKIMILFVNRLKIDNKIEPTRIHSSQNVKSNHLNRINILYIIEYYIVKKRNKNSYPNITLEQLIDKINNNKNLLYP